MKRFHEARFLQAVTDPAALGACFAEVAFVGRSNVGKSSLLNAICGKKNLSFTSQTPGRTRTISAFLAAKNCWVVDLPGYGFAVGPGSERAQWQEMIEGYLKGRPSLRMVFVLVDAKVGPTKLDGQMALWLQSNAIPYRIVANKCDKVSVPAQAQRRTEVAHALGLSAENIRWVSAAKGVGIKELEREIAELFELR
jgi:GTP-binding protein